MPRSHVVKPSRTFAMLKWLLLASVATVLVESRLIMVNTLTRHGYRSPNPVVTKLCPGIFKDEHAVADSFGVPPGELTKRGINEMRSVGNTIRQRYIEKLKFVPPDYARWQDLWSFQAPEKRRILISAQSIAQGIFNSWYPVAVMSKPAAFDNMLGIPAAACRPHTYRTIKTWLGAHAKTGGKFLASAAGRSIVHRARKICKNNIQPGEIDNPQNQGNPHPQMQDVCDLFEFVHSEEHLSVPGLDPSLAKQCASLSSSLMYERIFDDPKTMLRFAGLFPHALNERMQKAGNRTADEIRKGERSPKMFVSAASRELLYAIGRYYDMKFHEPHGMSAGFIKPGTTFVWELHGEGEPGNYYNEFVRTFYFAPDSKAIFKKVRVFGCAEDCPLSEFLTITTRWNKAAGVRNFQELCPKDRILKFATMVPMEQQQTACKICQATRAQTAQLDGVAPTLDLVGHMGGDVVHDQLQGKTQPRSSMNDVVVMLCMVGFIIAGTALVAVAIKAKEVKNDMLRANGLPTSTGPLDNPRRGSHADVTVIRL